MNQTIYFSQIKRIFEQELPFEQLKGTSVLVTGATGLIASCLTDSLMWLNREKDYHMQIYAMCRNEARAKQRFAEYAGDSSFRILIQDVADTTMCIEPVDYIIQAASSADPRAFSTDPTGVMLANLQGTAHLLEQVKSRGCRKFLYVSSGEIYGTTEADEAGFTEDTIGAVQTMDRRSCYPESKRAAETLCVSYGEQYAIDVTVVRPCHTYGPTITETNSRADAQFLRKALSGEDIVMKSEGLQRRSYCYVFDAVAGMFAALLRGEANVAYNIANKDSVTTVRGFAEELARSAGVRIRFELPDQTEARGYSNINHAVLNAGKLERLGWKPQYSLQEGIRNMLEILR